MSKKCLIGMLTFLAVATAALAGEGKKPIYQSTVLANPGKYILTRTINAPGTIIEIVAGDVEVDLNGFIVNNTGGGPVIFANGVNNVTIRNGTVIGGDEGIYLDGVEKATISDVRVVNSGFAGILLANTTEFSVRRAKVRGAAAEGILVDATALGVPAVGQLVDNQVAESDLGIRVVRGGALNVSGNRVQRIVTGAGIQIQETSGCQLTRNGVRETNGNGIFLDKSVACLVRENAVEQTNTGIFLSPGSNDNLLLNNLITGSVRHGIAIDGDRNHVEGNVSNSNGEWGLFVTGASFATLIRGNTARGNNTGGGAGCGVPPVSPDDYCNAGAGTDTNGDNWVPFLH